MKKKGFTLVEMLGVIVILGIVIGLGVAAYSKYVTSSRNKSYGIAEKSLKSSATDAIVDCLSIYGKNREFCQNHNVLENQYEYEVIYLRELVDDDYMDEIRDPYNTDQLCSGNSYVYITNKADTNQINNVDLNYKVCLICSNYKSKDCLDNIEDTNRDYNAYCKVIYGDGREYNGEWTDQDLKLVLTADGEYKYGISYYNYSYGNISKKLHANNNIGEQILNFTVDNKEIKVTAVDGMNGKSHEATCGLVSIDKEKLISAKINGVLADKKTKINSNVWASGDVLLTVTTNPKKIPSGATYEWYKDGEKIEGAIEQSYTATTDGIYHAIVGNTLGNQTVKTNEFIVKIDREVPTIKAKANPKTLNKDDYAFVSNVDYTIPKKSGGTVICNPKNSKKTGTYNVTCTVKGNNGLSASVTFTVKHSYAATCWEENDKCSDMSDDGCCQWIWDGGCHLTGGVCADTQYCVRTAPGDGCCGSWSKKTVCKCPNGGSLSGRTCVY